MKIRIQSNSIRYRLTKSEVRTLAETGFINSQTNIAGNIFTYALQTSTDIKELVARFQNNTITLLVPAIFAGSWFENEVVGIESQMPNTTSETLQLLLEKDFVCLDETTEDQRDHYENPGKNC